MAVTATLAAATAIGSWPRVWRTLSHLELVFASYAAFTCALILLYSAFFYHYPAFVAPWLALAAGGAAGGIAGSPWFRRMLVGAFAVVILGIAALQLDEVAPLTAPASAVAGMLIPTGACVVTDETSLTISANRFASLRPGCSRRHRFPSNHPQPQSWGEYPGRGGELQACSGSVAVHHQPGRTRLAFARERPPHTVDVRTEQLVPPELSTCGAV